MDDVLLVEMSQLEIANPGSQLEIVDLTPIDFEAM
jgi:hypothetical protein